MERRYTYEEAVAIYKQMAELQSQMPELVNEARKVKTASRIARDFELTEGRIFQLLRKYRKEADKE